MKKRTPYFPKTQPAAVLQDRPYALSDDIATGGGSMVRTQIYLTRSEHDFLSAEAARRREPMAAVIRGYIDDKMRLPDTAWESNSMLEATPKDPAFALPEDAAINHDHYLYGTPKRFVKKRGIWVHAEEKPNAEA